MNDMEVPKSSIEAYKIVLAGPNENITNPLENKENLGDTERRKSVRFKVPANIDDDEEW